MDDLDTLELILEKTSVLTRRLSTTGREAKITLTHHQIVKTYRAFRIFVRTTSIKAVSWTWADQEEKPRTPLLIVG